MFWVIKERVVHIRKDRQEHVAQERYCEGRGLGGGWWTTSVGNNTKLKLNFRLLLLCCSRSGRAAAVTTEASVDFSQWGGGTGGRVLGGVMVDLLFWSDPGRKTWSGATQLVPESGDLLDWDNSASQLQLRLRFWASI